MWSSVLLVLFGCHGRITPVEQTELLLGTYVRIQLYDINTKKAEVVLQQAFREIARIDTLAGTFVEPGELATINKTGTGRISPELKAIIEHALEVSGLSQGEFDITVYPLEQLWGFYTGNYLLPAQSEIKQALKSVGYTNIVLTGDSIYLRNRARIDLGGIAKGYAVDRACEIIQANGIRTGLVDAGGDIRVFGNKPGGKPWRIGIKNPRGEGIIKTVEVSDQAITTSGDYEKCFEIDHSRYHHILDPKTGYPARPAISVTIIGPDALSADALATAVFVLGPERGVKLVESIPSTECLIITEANGSLQFFRSKGFKW